MQKCSLANKEVMKSQRKWYTIDATGIILGDLSVKVANILRGKNKANFTPSVDCGDYVIVTNAANVKITGNKLIDKKYYTHSGFIGHLKSKTLKEKMEKEPEVVVFDSIKGMIPKTKLGNAVALKLFVYKDNGKDHSAQNPIKINI